MKKIHALILLLVISLFPAVTVSAQSADRLWIQAATTAYKTNETVLVSINAVSATPIQGFTTQIRYDPACLQPVNGTSPIPTMNGLAVPQQTGLVDVSFASTTPQPVNGVLAEVRFTALKGCQTRVTVESAALVIRNESGFAVPVSGTSIDQNPLVLNIDSEEGSPSSENVIGATLPLTPSDFPTSKSIQWQVVIWPIVAGVIVTFIAGLYKLAGTSAH